MRLVQRDRILRQRHQADRQASRHRPSGPAAVRVRPSARRAGRDFRGSPPDRPIRSAILWATSQWPARIGTLTCRASARPCSTALASSAGGASAKMRVMARTNRFGELRLVAHVDAGKVLAKGDLVAERRRQQVGVGIAADVAKQGLMIDIAALIDRRGRQPRPAASPARRIAAQNLATDRWPGRSHRPAPSRNRRVELLVPPFGSVLVTRKR